MSGIVSCFNARAKHHGPWANPRRRKQTQNNGKLELPPNSSYSFVQDLRFLTACLAKPLDWRLAFWDATIQVHHSNDPSTPEYPYSNLFSQLSTSRTADRQTALKLQVLYPAS